MAAREVLHRTSRSGVFWVGVVAAAFAVGQVALIPLDFFISWDEAIYASRFSTSTPTTTPSPHRSSGMALVLAPATAATHSMIVIRSYLTVVTTLGVFLAYRAWVPVSAPAAVLGALLFASSSMVVRHGHLVEPNLLTACSAVAAVGYFARAGDARGKLGPLVGVVLALGVMSVVRPTDAVFLAFPLFVAGVLVPRWRRLAMPVSVLAGLTIGGIVWVTESLVYYGGPLRRFAELRSTTGAGSDPVLVKLAASIAARATDSPTWAVASAAIGVASLVVLVLLVRRACHGWPQPAWPLTLVAAFFVIFPYYLLLSYTSARYMIPLRALLALVAAAAICRLIAAWPGARRAVVAGAVSALVFGYVGAELSSAASAGEALAEQRQARAQFAEKLRAQGIRPPCVTSGVQAPAFAYALGCVTGDNITTLPSTNNWKYEIQRDLRRAKRTDSRFVAVQYGEERPPVVRDWPRVKLGMEGSLPVYAYFPLRED